jgi:hypothetical protein
MTNSIADQFLVWLTSEGNISQDPGAVIFPKLGGGGEAIGKKGTSYIPPVKQVLRTSDINEIGT